MPRIAGRLLIACMAGLALTAVAAGGCARPQGRLFEPIGPPLLWPPAPETPRIRFLGTLSDSGDLNAAQSGAEILWAAFRGPRPPIKFSRPQSVAVSPTGLLAVADGATAAVHLIDLERRDHRRIAGWDDERFAVPFGVTWAGQRLLVTDAQRHEIIELDAQGAFRRTFGGDALVRPVGITYVSSRDRLYVVDGGAHCVKVFDLAGTMVSSIGTQGTAPGSFNYPTYIGAARDRLVVADSGNFRVQLLDLDGNPLAAIGQKGDGAGDFALPKGVAFDSAGHVYVADAQFENVQVFDDRGRLLLAFGQEGSAPGEFWLPAGLTIDHQDRIWVADSGNRRLQVFEYMGASS